MEVKVVRLNDYIAYLDERLKKNPIVKDGIIEEYCPFPEGVKRIDSFDSVYNNITDLEKFITKGAYLVQALSNTGIIEIPGSFPLTLNRKKVQAFEEHIKNNEKYFRQNKKKFQQFGTGLFYLIYIMRVFYNNSILFVPEILKDGEAYRLLDKSENKFLVADNYFQFDFPYNRLLEISKKFGKDIAKKVLEEIGKKQILTDVTFVNPENIQKGITDHIDLKGFVSLHLFTFETVEKAVKFLADYNCNVTYIRNSIPIEYDKPIKSLNYTLSFINNIPFTHYRKLVKFGVLSGDKFFEIISKLSYEELRELGLTDNEIRNIFKANGRYSLPFIKASLHLGKTLIPVNTKDFLNDKEVMENINKLYVDDEKLMEQLIKSTDKTEKIAGTIMAINRGFIPGKFTDVLLTPEVVSFVADSNDPELKERYKKSLSTTTGISADMLVSISIEPEIIKKLSKIAKEVGKFSLNEKQVKHIVSNLTGTIKPYLYTVFDKKTISLFHKYFLHLGNSENAIIIQKILNSSSKAKIVL